MFIFQALRHLDIKICTILASIATGFGYLLICCYHGESVTENYLRYADCLYDSNWIELSVKLQNYYKMIIRNANIPYYYHGFGMFDLNLEILKQVTNEISIQNNK